MLSIVILLSLFLPWVTVSCAGVDVATLSGMNAAVGANIEGEETGTTIEVIIVAILALVGLTSVVLPLAVRVVVSGVGLATLIFMFIRLKAEVADAGQGLGISFEIGYWLALVAFLAIGVLQFLSLGGNRGAASSNEEGAVHPP